MAKVYAPKKINVRTIYHVFSIQAGDTVDLPDDGPNSHYREAVTAGGVPVDEFPSVEKKALEPEPHPAEIELDRDLVRSLLIEEAIQHILDTGDESVLTNGVPRMAEIRKFVADATTDERDKALDRITSNEEQVTDGDDNRDGLSN